MEEASREEKWQAKVSAILTKTKPDQIWPLFTDFFNLNKWLPTLGTCHGVHGNNGELGCIRFCSGSSIGSNGVTSAVGWSKEKLVAIDPVERVMRYEIVESNIGFESYVSTVKISPCGEVEDIDGCVIEWSFTVDPVRGLSLDNLVKKYEKALGVIAKNMEEALTRGESSFKSC
ncbi:PREDICTED: lachrymatory-factor synthase-like [Camelina sativa]|uniref:Lachrymatory-factor synthase-like n=1 Tax=Camelina sativa TaxID=90675 RepID=A0ABM0TQ41_CAMSA|nr:PREDICTED: lachrymatory-factor synthase-like [Camelina sativa]